MCNSGGCGDKRATDWWCFDTHQQHVYDPRGELLGDHPCWCYQHFHSGYLWWQPADITHTFIRIHVLNSKTRIGVGQNAPSIPYHGFHSVLGTYFMFGPLTQWLMGYAHAAPATCVECSWGSESVGNQETRKRLAGWREMLPGSGRVIII